MRRHCCGAGGLLTRDTYAALGVRQSIFPSNARHRLYDLFERYRSWLADAGLFDPSLIAQDWLALAAPRYVEAVGGEAGAVTLLAAALGDTEGEDGRTRGATAADRGAA